MSDIKQVLKRHLVSNLNTSEIHYTGAPNKTTPPYGVISIISNWRTRTHDGPDGLLEPRVQLDWFGRTDSEVEQLTKSTIDLFNEIQNETIGAIEGEGGIFIAQIEVINEFDDYEEDTGLYHKVLDLNIQYEEG